jgi:methyl-accepting chemotaxis protein
MKLRTIFFIGFAAVSLPATGWSTWVAKQAWMARADAVAATHIAEAMGNVMRVATGVAVETGQLLEAALAPAPNSDMLRRSAEVTDRALADAEGSLTRAGLPLASVREAARAMREARGSVAEAVKLPPDRRDSTLPADLLAKRVALAATLRSLVGSVETRAMRADPGVGSVAQLGSLTMEMREYAGTRSVVLTPWIDGRAYAPEEVGAAAMLSGRVAQSWDRVKRAIDQVGESARLRDARDAAQRRFFDQAEPVYAAFVGAALSRSAWPMAYADFRRWTVSVLAELVPLREAIMAEAVARGQAAAAAARHRLLAAAGLAGGTLALAVGAFLLLLRRIVSPVGALTGVVTRLARGELSLDIPYEQHTDEIGAMAAAVEVFRQGLIERSRLEAEAEAARAAREARTERTEALVRGFEKETAEALRAVAAASTELDATAGEMTEVAAEGAVQAGAVAAASGQANANVQAMAASVEGMAASTTKVARQVAESSAAARRAAEEARATDAAVQDLAQAAARIGEVVRLIGGITGQTNLLALNATIEAARAGEAGKGFAVVASEVKQLAQQTAKATQEIGAQIAAMQAETGRVVEAIRGITGTIEQLNGSAGQVAAAEEQAAATREIGRSVAETAAGAQGAARHAAGITNGAGQTSAAALQVRAASSELARHAEELRGRVDAFLAGICAA